MVIDKREVGASLFRITPFYPQILKFKVQSRGSVYRAEFWSVPNVCKRVNHNIAIEQKNNLRGQKGLRVREPLSAAAEMETGRSGWSRLQLLTQEGAVTEPAAGLALGAGARQDTDAVLIRHPLCAEHCAGP